MSKMEQIKQSAFKIASYVFVTTFILLSWYGAFHLGINLGNYLRGG